VKGVLVNIFGGIMRCDVIAEGVVAAAKEVDLEVPLVVRLEGTNVELGKKILERVGPRHHQTAATWTRPPRRSSRPRAELKGGNDEHLVDKRHQGPLPGHHRRRGHASTRSRCIEYGTKMVAGVTPGKGGSDVEGIPVFDTVPTP
jgi:hypothetical protein